MAVYRRSYTSYSGALTPTWSRWLVLFRYSRRTLFRSKFQTGLFALCFFYPVFCLFAIYLAHNLDFLQKFGAGNVQFVVIDSKFFFYFVNVQAEMALALKQLGPDAQRVQVLFVTLDPDRDTSAVLGQYVPSFNPTFLGLRGDTSATAEMAKRFKVFAQKHETGGGSGYTLDHSASSFIFDPTGKPRLLVSFGHGPQAVAHDLKLLLH